MKKLSFFIFLITTTVMVYSHDFLWGQNIENFKKTYDKFDFEYNVSENLYCLVNNNETFERQYYFSYDGLIYVRDIYDPMKLPIDYIQLLYYLYKNLCDAYGDPEPYSERLNIYWRFGNDVINLEYETDRKIFSISYISPLFYNNKF